MVREENNRLIFDNGVSVEIIKDKFCPVCKQVNDRIEVCNQCRSKKYSFNSVLTIGYYIGKWYEKSDAFTTSKKQYWINYNLNETNPKFRFCKLINDAKGKNWIKSEDEKREIIRILTSGFAWKMHRYDQTIVNNIDFLVHVPKYNEGLQGIEIKKFNHAFYYAKMLAERLKKPFYADLIIENEYFWKKGLDRFSTSVNPQRIKNKSVMIVDDVYTSGKTTSQISELLIQNGASEVYIGVIARTKR